MSQQPQAKTTGQDRLKREKRAAEALRENLRKRKAQSLMREAQSSRTQEKLQAAKRALKDRE